MANFNVVKDYDWTTIPRGSGLRKNAPKVYIRSFKYKSSEALNRLVSYIKATGQSDPFEYYRSLYSDAVEEEDTFFLPYLNDSIREFTNTYSDTFSMESLGAVDAMLSKVTNELAGVDSLLGGAMSDIRGGLTDALVQGSAGDLKGAGKTAMNAAINAAKNLGSTKPGSNNENPKLYQYEPSDTGVTVSFVLSNTVNKDWEKNYELVKKLIEINRPRRTSYTFMEPPRIYKVKIPGLRYIEWASCSNFSATMLGTKRQIGGKIVPEGYLINMTFTSLTIEVNNFMERM